MKKISKKIILGFIFTILVFSLTFFNPATVLAKDSPEKLNIFQKYLQGLQPAVDESYGGGETVKLSGDPFTVTIVGVVNNLLTFLAVIFFILLLYAGYLWMTARGNEEQTAKAKKMIQNIIIGLLIIILARLIVEFTLGQIKESITP